MAKNQGFTVYIPIQFMIGIKWPVQMYQNLTPEQMIQHMIIDMYFLTSILSTHKSVPNTI